MSWSANFTDMDANEKHVKTAHMLERGKREKKQWLMYPYLKGHSCSRFSCKGENHKALQNVANGSLPARHPACP